MERREVASSLVRVAAKLLAGLCLVARGSAPRLATAARAIGRGLHGAARLVRDHRGMFGAIAVRLAFWAALALWATTAIDVLGGAAFDPALAVRRFAVGAVVCAFVVVLAVARRVRWAGWALGSLHGASATALWLLAQA